MRKRVGEEYNREYSHCRIAYMHKGGIPEISYPIGVDIVYTSDRAERRKSGRYQVKQGQEKTYPVAFFLGVRHKNDLSINFFINIVQ